MALLLVATEAAEEAASYTFSSFLSKSDPLADIFHSMKLSSLLLSLAEDARRGDDVSGVCAGRTR